MLKITVVVAAAMIASAGGLSAQQRHCQTASDSTGHVMEGGGMMGMTQGGAVQGAMMQGGMMQGGGGMMEMMPASGAMMRGMQFAPARVKDLGDSLDLTAEQITALNQLMEQRAAAHRELKASATAAGESLSELFDAETVDSAAVRSTALDAFEAQAAMHAQKLVDAAAVLGILTASQREIVEDLTMARGRHCQNGNR